MARYELQQTWGVHLSAPATWNAMHFWAFTHCLQVSKAEIPFS